MTRAAIEAVRARRVWDSRGRPTVEAEILLAGGAIGRAIAPAGASTGSGEALDRRDGGERLGGMDVSAAIASVNDTIAPALLGMAGDDQAAVDARMIALDGTPQKARLGGNATIAVSMALAHAAAAARGLPLWAHLAEGREVSLPLPEIQIFGGGKHAQGRVDIQDFLVVCPGAETFAEALVWTAEIYRAAGELMAEAGRLKGVADEGGYWPEFESNEQALGMLVRAIERAGFRPLEQVAIALDIAASSFGSGGRYRLGLERRELDTDAMIEMLLGWLDRYPIVSIEDPVAEDDAEGFAALHGGRRRPLPGRRRRFSRDQRRARARLRRPPGPARPCSSSPTSAARSPRPGRPGTRHARSAWAASSRRAPARARTRRSSISPSAGACPSSRSARSAAPSAWPNGTRASGSRRRWAIARGSPGAGRFAQPLPGARSSPA